MKALRVTAALIVSATAMSLTACGSRGHQATATTTTSTAITITVMTTAVTAIDRPLTLVDNLGAVNGARMHIRCIGKGDRTVLLIAGFNDGGNNWDSVESTLTETSRVCSYARYGTGTSDPPPPRQTFTSEADDLHALLESAGEPGPYVVVGHSFGGPEAVAFASRFRSEVTGLVLIDASPVTWQAAVCAVPDDGTEAAHGLADDCASQADPTLNSEHLDTPTADAEVAQITSLGVLPVTVITASHHAFDGLAPAFEAALNKAWDAGQQRWLQLSTAARLITVEHTGHYIQLDQPAIVIEAIRPLSL